MPKGIFGYRGKPAVCHMDKPNYSFGLCHSCYGKKLYKENPIVFKNRKIKQYGITLNEYLDLLEKQNHCCAICKSKEPKQGKSMYFHIDHDHDTKKVRGLLCGPCNRGIGYLQDNPEFILNAYNYVREIKR